MKSIKLTIVALCSVAFLAQSCNTASTSSSSSSYATKGEIDSVSYALGASLGMMISQNGLTELNMAEFDAAFKKASKGDTTLKISQDQINSVIQTYMMKKMEFEAKSTTEEGVKFLQENKSKDGVVTTESGLQYKIITEGTGAKPTADDSVEVHYKGTFIDGKEFDSSYARNEPVTFPLNNVIKGWTEGFQNFSEGTKAVLYIPSELAYGAQGNRGIKPNSTLIFEVELLKVIPADAAASQPTK